MERTRGLPLAVDHDAERGGVWSSSSVNLPWQRNCVTPSPLPGSPVRQSSSNEKDHDDETAPESPLHLTFKERIRHFVWTWFTMTMATGQLANVILEVPFNFPGLHIIGTIVFILNLVLFLLNLTLLSLRFYYHPHTFTLSLTHPTEHLFVPASLVSLGTILTTITTLGVANGKTGPWLTTTMTILFFVYCGLALAFTCAIYLTMWSTQSHRISRMTPVWIFPAYPLLIIGSFAGTLSARTPPASTSLAIIITGFTLQGIGFMMSLSVYSSFLYRLMTQKLPPTDLRPGMFISVGPSAFTTAGLISMATNLGANIPDDFMNVGELAGTISVVLANWTGIWLWGLAVFFFIVSLGAHWSVVKGRKLRFSMTWYSFIFPNTGLTTATFAIAKALKCRGLNILGCVFTCLLILVWAFVFVMMIRAVIRKDILWPQKQEDRDEGDWKIQGNLEKSKTGETV